MFDLGIEGGTVVTPAGRWPANVYVTGGRIATLAAGREPAKERYDATGSFVMPGMVDTHVHLMDPASTDREDFPTGTAAAARAGVTTIIEHTHGGPVRTPKDLHEKASYLRGRSRIDFGLAAHAWPDRIDQVAPLWGAGVSFFKVFTCTTHGIPGFDAGHLLDVFREVARAGGICLVHCEDEAITMGAERALRAAGRDDPGVIPAWRSREGELAALSLTALLARSTGVRVVAAHVSHLEAVEILERERGLGARLWLETCPQYLTLLEQDIMEHGPFRKFTPPARARSAADLQSMWGALRRGRIHHISTDHAPSTVEQKTSGSIWDVHFGLPGLDTTLSVLLDGAYRGLLGYERVVEAYAETPARLYGLFPRKGTLTPGADADIAVVRPEAAWTVRKEDVVSRAGWSPYEGTTLIGRCVRTYLRGTLVADEGQVVAESGMGRFLPGPGLRGEPR